MTVRKVPEGVLIERTADLSCVQNSIGYCLRANRGLIAEHESFEQANRERIKAGLRPAEAPALPESVVTAQAIKQRMKSSLRGSLPIRNAEVPVVHDMLVDNLTRLQAERPQHVATAGQMDRYGSEHEKALSIQRYDHGIETTRSLARRIGQYVSTPPIP